MLTEKSITICIFKILEEYSSENCILSMKDIQQKLSDLFELFPDRRTIYSSLNILLSVGYDISLYSENKKGYYLRGKNIDKNELRLLTSAVCAFPYISAKKRENLIEKIQSQKLCCDANIIKNLIVADTGAKYEIEDIFDKLDAIDKAIENKLKIKFDYYENGDKNKKTTANMVVPCSIVFIGGGFYLAAAKTEYEILSYRIDFIDNLSVTYFNVREEDMMMYKIISFEKVQEFCYGKISMVELMVQKDCLNEVVEKFGKDILTERLYEEGIKVSMKVPLKLIKNFALNNLSKVEVLAPDYLRGEIIDEINNNLYREKAHI